MFEKIKKKIHEFTKTPEVQVKPVDTKQVDKQNFETSPKGGKRETAPSELISYGGILRESSISPDYPVEYVKAIRHLCMWNPDFSLALENVVTLSNTPFEITIPEGGKKSLVKELYEIGDSWYKNSGGINSLRNDLLTQLVITGAISAEIVPNSKLDGVSKTVMVSTENIVFKYDREEEEYMPYQTNRGTEDIKLNTNTYKYSAFRRLSEKPYAVPMFLSALDNTAIEKDMVSSIREVVKTLGLAGFMEVLLSAPPKRPAKGGKPAETQKEYSMRLSGLLMEAETEIKKGLGNGYMIGFEGQHKFEMKATNANMGGAEKLMQINTEMKHAGLKQSPSLLGRNYSTTETLGRVVLTILTSQVQNYQQTVDKFLSEAYSLHLELKTGKRYKVKVTSQKPMINDEESDQNAFSTKIDNHIKLYNQGIISQEQFAQGVGYVSAHLPEPIAEEIPKAESKVEVKQNSLVAMYNSKFENYPDFKFYYDKAENSKKYIQDFEDEKDKLIFKELTKYLKATHKNYDKALDSVIRELAKTLSKGKNTEAITLNKVYLTLFGNWESSFSVPQVEITKERVQNSYKLFRTDKGIFNVKKKGSKVPEAVFNTTDFRTIAYMQDMDAVYLGKFISDDHTIKQITRFVQETFLEDANALRSNAAIDKFTKQFKGVLKGVSWKIDQVLATTVSRMRYNASMLYYSQAKVVNYTRLGISDRLQCRYCASMDGKTFKVSIPVKRIKKNVQTSVESVKEVQPFITTVFPDPADVEALTSAELQAKGVEAVPSHPHCRCTNVADI